jgi:hypothetical protein
MAYGGWRHDMCSLHESIHGNWFITPFSTTALQPLLNCHRYPPNRGLDGSQLPYGSLEKVRNFLSLSNVDFILSPKASRYAKGNSQTSAHLVSGATFQDKGGRTVKFTIHLILCRGWEWSYKSTPPNSFMAWTGNIYSTQAPCIPHKTIQMARKAFSVGRFLFKVSRFEAAVLLVAGSRYLLCG